MIDRAVWYRRPDVLFQIVQACRDREIALLRKDVGSIRCIFAQNTSLLRRNFDSFRFIERPFNIYYSLATVKGIRMFSFSPAARKEEYKVWNAEFMEHLQGLDFGLDFDAPEPSKWQVAHKDCKIVKSLLDECKVPYSLKFSGGGGFHIRVPFLAFRDIVVLADDDEDVKSANFFFKLLGEALQARFELDSLDLSIFDYRRVWKADYSLAEPYGLVVLPLTDEQFDAFTLEMVQPEKVLQAGLYNRGALLRPGNSEGVTKLLDFVGMGDKD